MWLMRPIVQDRKPIYPFLTALVCVKHYITEKLINVKMMSCRLFCLILEFKSLYKCYMECKTKPIQIFVKCKVKLLNNKRFVIFLIRKDLWRNIGDLQVFFTNT